MNVEAAAMPNVITFSYVYHKAFINDMELQEN